jgi:putative tryptophan/tyrosine transport system substrate-binding protein
MKRRTFIAGLGGMAAWPLAARAQQPNRMQRVAVLMAFEERDPEAKAFFSAFRKVIARSSYRQ